MCNTGDKTNDRNVKIKSLEEIIHTKNKELAQLQAELSNLKNESKRLCIKNHRHCWETHREAGLYGEKYSYCPMCDHEI